ncbi:MAG TPA: bacillithiol transferase BstA [Candidatus Acidoferrales bacterium]|nr:bacillithiol transferase BstA [Candidatus Acidoferrales bacterium]
MEDLSYPIGKFIPEQELTEVKRRQLVDDIAAVPAALRAAVSGLTKMQLDTPYRPGGWTVRQVVHHVPDSHMNAYIRFRLALTENEPMIKPYEQQLWAELPDARTADIEMSLNLLESLHQRWVLLLRSMKPEDFNRKFVHPESGVSILDKTLQMYAWHGKHHVAHITSLKKRMGW